MKRVGFSFIVLLNASGALASGVYVVRPGDVLSRIARKTSGKPVYGKNGTLAQLLALNPTVHGPNVIFPGQTIQLAGIRTLASEPTQATTQNPTAPAQAQPLTLPDSEGSKIGDMRPETAPQSDANSSASQGYSGQPPPPSRFASQHNAEPGVNSTPAPSETPTASSELIFKLDASEGPTLLVFQQSGAFGAGSGTALAMTGLGVRAALDYDLWNFTAEMQNYSLDFGTSTVDPTQSQSESLQTFALKMGYGFLSVGVQARSLPVSMVSGTNALSWTTLTTIAPTAGIHLEKEYISPKHRKFTLSADLTASRPLAASGGAGGIQASGLTGIGAGASFGAKKTVLDGDACKIRLGLDVSADYLHLSYTGTSGSTQGTVTQGLQEYSTKVGVEFEF